MTPSGPSSRDGRRSQRRTKKPALPSRTRKKDWGRSPAPLREETSDETSRLQETESYQEESRLRQDNAARQEIASQGEPSSGFQQSESGRLGVSMIGASCVQGNTIGGMSVGSCYVGGVIGTLQVPTYTEASSTYGNEAPLSAGTTRASSDEKRQETRRRHLLPHRASSASTVSKTRYEDGQDAPCCKFWPHSVSSAERVSGKTSQETRCCEYWPHPPTSPVVSRNARKETRSGTRCCKSWPHRASSATMRRNAPDKDRQGRGRIEYYPERVAGVARAAVRSAALDLLRALRQDRNREQQITRNATRGRLKRRSEGNLQDTCSCEFWPHRISSSLTACNVKEGNHRGGRRFEYWPERAAGVAETAVDSSALELLQAICRVEERRNQDTEDATRGVLDHLTDRYAQETRCCKFWPHRVGSAITASSAQHEVSPIGDRCCEYVPEPVADAARAATDSAALDFLRSLRQDRGEIGSLTGDQMDDTQKAFPEIFKNLQDTGYRHGDYGASNVTDLPCCEDAMIKASADSAILALLEVVHRDQDQESTSILKKRKRLPRHQPRKRPEPSSTISTWRDAATATEFPQTDTSKGKAVVVTQPRQSEISKANPTMTRTAEAKGTIAESPTSKDDDIVAVVATEVTKEGTEQGDLPMCYFAGEPGAPSAPVPVVVEPEVPAPASGGSTGVEVLVTYKAAAALTVLLLLLLLLVIFVFVANSLLLKPESLSDRRRNLAAAAWATPKQPPTNDTGIRKAPAAEIGETEADVIALDFDEYI